MHNTSSRNTLTVNQNHTSANKLRILHVVASMNRGGIETWLMDVLRHIDRDRFGMDFLVHTTQPCAYDDEIRSFNSRIIPCLHPSRPWTYASNFKRILREYSPYDIVHSHVHHFNGYILRLAKQAGIPIRIAHSHTDSSSSDAKTELYRRLYFTLTKRWINRYATVGLGGSSQAVVALFGSLWKNNPRWRVLNYGIVLTPFQECIDSIAVRAELGIPVDAFVIGHVGRFAEVKNHTFLLDIAAEVVKKEPKMRLLLVGDGPLRSSIEQKVTEIGLSNYVIFAGVRSNVARLMRGAMNMFLLPSLREGLPLVLLEAQAAGLPCLFSDIVTTEVEVVKPLMKRLPLSQPATTWAQTILAMRNAGLDITQTKALMQVQQSSFNIETSINEIEKLYLEKLGSDS